MSNNYQCRVSLDWTEYNKCTHTHTGMVLWLAQVSSLAWDFIINWFQNGNVESNTLSLLIWSPQNQLFQCKYVVIITSLTALTSCVISFNGRVCLHTPAPLSQLGCWSQQWWEGHVCVYIRQQLLGLQWYPLGHEYPDTVVNILWSFSYIWIILNATKYKLSYTCYYFKSLESTYNVKSVPDSQWSFYKSTSWLDVAHCYKGVVTWMKHLVSINVVSQVTV